MSDEYNILVTISKALIRLAEALEKNVVATTKQVIVTQETTPKAKKAFIWFKVKDEPKAKVRKCDDIRCPYYLKYISEEGRYHHGKYDLNTMIWVYVSDICEYWGS